MSATITKKYLELSEDEGVAHKFYEVTVDGCEMSIRYGRIGAKGQCSVKTLATPEKAEAEATAFLESSVYASSEKMLVSNVGLGEDRERSCSPDQTHKDLYENVKDSEAMTTPISFSHFTKCRPAQVRLM